MARIYDPPYDAATPPVSCRRAIVPKTNCCLYYVIDEAERTLYFLKLGDTRENPLKDWRFETHEGFNPSRDPLE